MADRDRSHAYESNSANGAMLSPTPSAIEVVGGTFVDLLKPEPWTLTLRSIAHGLAYTCRYGGQVTRFYSVAEHSVLVHDLLRHRGAGPDTLRGALFHDTSEGYLGDVVAPLKWALRAEELVHDPMSWTSDPARAGRRSAYDHLSDRMDAAIDEAFKIDRTRVVAGDVALADMWALRIEARVLTTSGGAHWRWPGELPENGELPAAVRWDAGLNPDDARVLWLDAIGAPAEAYEERDGRG